MAKEHSERNTIKSGVHGHLLNKSSSRTVLVGREELQNNFVYPPIKFKIKILDMIFLLISSSLGQ